MPKYSNLFFYFFNKYKIALGVNGTFIALEAESEL